MIRDASWVGLSVDFGEICPSFVKSFTLEGSVKKATLSLSAIGVYEAKINSHRIGDFINSKAENPLLLSGGMNAAP